MAFQVSPGVNVTEFDLTTIVPAPTGPVGAIVGEFPWGPLDILQPVENEIKLVERFGKPAISGNAATNFHTAANYLGYSSNLLVVRPSATVAAGNCNNAIAGTLEGAVGNVQIKNSSDYSRDYIETSNTVDNAVFAARYAGDLGNNLKVSMFKGSAPAFANWEYSSLFDRPPGTTYYVSEKFNTNAQDEVYIVVVDETSAITGAANTVLEKYTASVAKNAKDENNNSLYYRDLLFNKSRWIYWVGHPYNEAFTLASTSDTELNVASLTLGDDLEFELADPSYLIVGDTVTLTNTANSLVVTGDVLSISSSNVVTVNVTAFTPDSGGSAGANVADVWVASGTNAGANVKNDWGVDANSTHVFGELRSYSNCTTFSLANGVYNLSNPSQAIYNALDLLADPAIDISLLMTGATSNVTVQNKAIQVATDRKDCMAFVSPPLATVTGNDPAAGVAAWAETLTNSSYGVADSGWKYQYDKYNDIYRYTPLNGDVAGACARTDATRDPWYSPAGQVRGQVRNIVRLAWNPSQSDRDTLYRADVNPVSTFQGEGTYLFGDKTLLGKPSAFDRINVRRLFITLEKAISNAARASLFEFNDEFTRSQFVALVDPYLRSVQAGRGIYDYRVVCDSRNNTADVIDRNQFVGDIFIKPSRSINFIQLNFVALRTGVSFEEITGV